MMARSQISKALFIAGSLLALSLALPGTLSAQGAGGEEKKTDEGGQKEEGEKQGGTEKPEGKPDEGAEKTLAFEKAAPWKKGRASGAVKAAYTTEAAEGDAEGATIQVRALGSRTTWDKQVDFWCSHYEGRDGKKLDKSAVKTESLEANGVKIKMAEFSGTFVSRSRKKAESGEGRKTGQRTIGCLLEGPDGDWVVSIYGHEKSVEKAREDFMKFVKSVKVVEKSAWKSGKSTKSGSTKGGED